MINIAVMGYGTVGSGVVEVINTNGARINQRIGDELNIKYVLDMKDFPGDPVQEKIVHDVDVIINDPEIDVVDINTNQTLHVPIAMASLKAGKRGFLEKHRT